MSSTLLLNYDILCEIAYWADRCTCASLLLTCRALNKATAKAILRQPCYLSKEEDVHRFLRFLHADPSRFQHVRELHLSFESLPEELEGNFMDGLRRMVRLEKLHLLDGENILSTFPRLLDTIAQLTTIRKLHVACAGDVTCALLSKMQAKLTHISLDWLQEDDDFFSLLRSFRYHAWPDYHPVPLLSKWQATLEELKCASWFTYPDELPKFAQVYPRLRRLSIDRDDNPRVAPYVRAYPNLAELCVLTDYEEVWSYLTWDNPAAAPVDSIQQLHERHAANVQSQAEAGTWPQLQQFEGTLLDLYLLGLTCPILRVSLFFYVNPRDLDLLPPVLASARPQHLKMLGTGVLLAHHTNGLTKLLREPGAARLESLVLSINLVESEGLDVVSTLNDLAGALKCLPLTRLRLRVNGSMLDPSPGGPEPCGSILAREHGKPNPPRPDAAPITTFERALRSVDVDAYAQDLADAIPSLEDVVVCVMGERDDALQFRKRVAEVVRVRRAEYADEDMYEWPKYY